MWVLKKVEKAFMVRKTHGGIKMNTRFEYKGYRVIIVLAPEEMSKKDGNHTHHRWL